MLALTVETLPYPPVPIIPKVSSEVPNSSALAWLPPQGKAVQSRNGDP